MSTALERRFGLAGKVAAVTGGADVGRRPVPPMAGGLGP